MQISNISIELQLKVVKLIFLAKISSFPNDFVAF